MGITGGCVKVCYFVISLWISVPHALSENVEFNVTIEACLVQLTKDSYPYVYWGSKCVCRPSEASPGTTVRWEETFKGRTISTGRYFAILNVTSDNIETDDLRIECVVENENTKVSQTLSLFIDPPERNAQLLFNEPDAGSNTLYKSPHCPKRLVFQCRTPLKPILLLPKAWANFTVYQDNGAVKRFNALGRYDPQEESFFEISFEVQLNDAGHVFVRCTTTTSFDEAVTTVAQHDFYVIEKSPDPVIDTLPGHQTPASFLCFDQNPQGKTAYVTRLRCNGRQAIDTGSKGVNLQVPVSGALTHVDCRCELMYPECGHSWVVDKRFVMKTPPTVTKEGGDVLEEILKTQTTNTPLPPLPSTPLPPLPSTPLPPLPSTPLPPLPSTPLPPTSETSATGFPVKKRINSTDNGDDDGEEEEEEDGAGLSGTRLALLVAGLVIVILVASGAFFCIGTKVGFKRKSKYGMTWSSRRGDGACNAAGGPQAGDGRLDIVQMVGLESDANVYSLVESDWSGTADHQMKTRTPNQQNHQHKHEKQQQKRLFNNQPTQEAPSTTSPVPSGPSDKRNQGETTDQQYAKAGPIANQLYDNNISLVPTLQSPGRLAGERVQGASNEGSIYDNPGGAGEGPGRKKKKGKPSWKEKLSKVQKKSGKGWQEDTARGKKSRQGLEGCAGNSYEDVIYDDPCSREMVNEESSKKVKVSHKLKLPKISKKSEGKSGKAKQKEEIAQGEERNKETFRVGDEDNIYDSPCNRDLLYEETSKKVKVSHKLKLPKKSKKSEEKSVNSEQNTIIPPKRLNTEDKGCDRNNEYATYDTPSNREAFNQDDNSKKNKISQKFKIPKFPKKPAKDKTAMDKTVDEKTTPQDTKHEACAEDSVYDTPCNREAVNNTVVQHGEMAQKEQTPKRSISLQGTCAKDASQNYDVPKCKTRRDSSVESHVYENSSCIYQNYSASANPPQPPQTGDAIKQTRQISEDGDGEGVYEIPMSLDCPDASRNVVAKAKDKKPNRFPKQTPETHLQPLSADDDDLYVRPTSQISNTPVHQKPDVGRISGSKPVEAIYENRMLNVYQVVPSGIESVVYDSPRSPPGLSPNECKQRLTETGVQENVYE